MATVAHFVHGRGRGHASRALTIVRALEERGHRVVLFAGGDALDLLAAGGPHELVEVAPVIPGLSALRRLPGRLRGDLRRLRGLAPDVVISDGDAPGVRAGRHLGIPVISVGHSQFFLHCELPSQLPRRRVAYERLVAGLTSAGADASVAVHFLPCEAADPTVRVARPDRPESLCGPVTDDGSIVAYLRDGLGLEALEAATAGGHRVRLFGFSPRPRVPAARGRDRSGAQRAVPEGVELVPFDREAFHQALRSCAAVIATAGSNLLAESVLLGKPVLALHRRGDHEQRINGLLAAAAGVAEAATIGEEALRARGASFLRRVDAGGFSTVDLEGALSPVSLAVAEQVEAFVGARST